MSTPEIRIDPQGRPWTLAGRCNHLLDIRSPTGSRASISAGTWAKWLHPVSECLLENPPDQTGTHAD